MILRTPLGVQKRIVTSTLAPDPMQIPNSILILLSSTTIRNESVSTMSTFGYLAYHENNNRNRYIRKPDYCFHFVLSFHVSFRRLASSRSRKSPTDWRSPDWGVG